MKKCIIQVLTLKGILKVISAMYLQIFLMLNIVSEVEVLTCNPFSTFFYRSPCICCSMCFFTTLWRGRETGGVLGVFLFCLLAFCWPKQLYQTSHVFSSGKLETGLWQQWQHFSISAKATVPVTGIKVYLLKAPISPLSPENDSLHTC